MRERRSRDKDVGAIGRAGNLATVGAVACYLISLLASTFWFEQFWIFCANWISDFYLVDRLTLKREGDFAAVAGSFAHCCVFLLSIWCSKMLFL